MEGVTREIVLDMTGGSAAMLKAKQCDTNSRFARITLMNGAAPWTIPFECEAYLYVLKPDKKVVFSRCDIVDKNVLIAPLTEQTLAVFGMARCELYIKTADWDIKSQTFQLIIEKMIFDDEALESTNEFSGLLEMLTQIQVVTESASNVAKLAEAEAVKANIAADRAKEAVERLQEAVDAAEQARMDRKAVETIRDYVEKEKDSLTGYSKQDSDRRYANAFAGFAAGAGNVHPAGAWRAPVWDMRVQGNCEQVTTTGAQLLNTRVERFENGITCTLEQNIAAFTGTITANVSYRPSVMANITEQLEIGKTYYASTDNVRVARDFRVVMIDDSIVYSNPYTMTGSEKAVEVRFICGLSVLPSGTKINESARVMVNEGTKALPWEPYTGGISAPDPKYPQDIRSVDDPVIVSSIGNRNLIANSMFAGFDKWENVGSWVLLDEQLDGQNVVGVDLSDQEPSEKGYKDMKQVIPFDAEHLTLNKPYTISFWLNVPAAGNYHPFQWYLTNITGSSTDNGWIPATRTTDGYIKVSKTIVFTEKHNNQVPIMYFRCFPGSSARISQPKFEQSDTATPWTPAIEDISAKNREQYRLYLSKVDLTNYNFQGIGTVCDVIECRDGVWGYEKHYGKTRFDGTEVWALQSINEYGVMNVQTQVSNIRDIKSGLCTHFRESRTGIADTKETCFFTGNILYIRLRKEDFPNQTVNAFKAWLAAEHAKGTPVTLVYRLKTPAWVPFADNVQAQFNDLLIYSGGQSAVYVKSGTAPDIAIKYVQDINIIVERLKAGISEREADALAVITRLKTDNNLI